MKLIFFTHRIKFLPRPEFSPAERIFTLRAPIFTMIIIVWPRDNRAGVTNNLNVIIEVMLIYVVLIEGFL